MCGVPAAPLAESTRCKNPVPVLPSVSRTVLLGSACSQPQHPSPGTPFKRRVTSRHQEKTAKSSKRKLPKAPSFHQKAHPALSSGTLRDICNPVLTICGQRRDYRGPSLGPGCAQTDHGCHLVQSKDTVASSHGGWRVTAGNQMPTWIDPEAKSFLHCGDKNILPVTMTSVTQEPPCQLHTWVLSSLARAICHV